MNSPFTYRAETLASALGRRPYRWMGEKLRREIKAICPQWEIWPRNSYLTKAFRPLKSDLDLTVWMPVAPSAEEQIRLRRILKKCKKLFRPLGECNVYVEDLALRFSRWQNIYERARDPRLTSSLVEEPSGIALRAQRVAFLLRMMDADRLNLLACPAKRQAKWEAHLSALGEPKIQNTFDDRKPFDSLLGAALFPYVEAQEPGWLFNRIRETKLYFARPSDRADGKIPAVWSSLFPHQFCSHHCPPKGELLAWIEITQAQLAWEIWGLQSQFILRPDISELNGHVKRLIRFCVEAAGTVGPEQGVHLQSLAAEFRALADSMKPIHCAEEFRQ